MPIKFEPNYIITPKTASNLMRIEACREKVRLLPVHPLVIASLRETAKLYTTHYSTMIEGNRLQPEQVESVLIHQGHFPGRERDEREVLGYYHALTEIEGWVEQGQIVTEKTIQTIHAMVMNEGGKKVRPSPYRDGQNVIRDSMTRRIVYLPPEAHDVPALMKGLVQWIISSVDIPCPVVAGIAHYQFATIHPYYDGNGRTARLITTMVLHSGGYDLKGLYSLEEYYARHLGAYYEAISVGDSHNYYMGRAEADITKWVDYFIEGMADSFERVIQRMQDADNNGVADVAREMKKLDPQQRKVLTLFYRHDHITSSQVAGLFGYKPRTASALCHKWVEMGFLEVTAPSKKNRKYQLGDAYKHLLA